LELDDSQLVDRARSGDKRAFRILVERYQKRVYGIAYGVVRNEEDALDVSQEAFIKVHRNLARFQGTSSFYTWLYRIVVNLCIDQKRRKSRAMQVDFDDSRDHGDVAEDSGGRISGSPYRDPARAVSDAELRDEMDRAMSALSDKHRRVVVLRELEGLSYKEIADVEEISVGTVMSRLHHARQNLQSSLRRYMKRE
jgi:RNA polymerase sigma-70 factor, ECF subfamily